MSNIRFAVSERETLKSGYHNKTLFSDNTFFKLSTETAFIKGFRYGDRKTACKP